MKDRAEFERTILTTLSKNPEWLPQAFNAICYAMQEAMAAVNAQRAAYDLAFRSALAISDPARLTPETKALMNKAIVKAIDPEGACKAELKALERIGKSGGEATVTEPEERG
jgi:hypothetical protein